MNRECSKGPRELAKRNLRNPRQCWECRFSCWLSFWFVFKTAQQKKVPSKERRTHTHTHTDTCLPLLAICWEQPYPSLPPISRFPRLHACLPGFSQPQFRLLAACGSLHEAAVASQRGGGVLKLREGGEHLSPFVFGFVLFGGSPKCWRGFRDRFRTVLLTSEWPTQTS